MWCFSACVNICLAGVSVHVWVAHVQLNYEYLRINKQIREYEGDWAIFLLSVEGYPPVMW